MSHAQPRTAATKSTPWCWVEIQDAASGTRMKVKAFYKNASYLAKLEFLKTYCFNRFLSIGLSCEIEATQI